MALTLHGNNGLGTTNGTAAAPSIAAPDSDTGLFFGTNLIHASTDGTERLRITSVGDIEYKYNDSDTSTQVGATQTPHGLRIWNTNNTSGRLSGINFSHGSGGTANAGIFHVTTNTATASNDNLGDLTFWTKDTGTSYMSERLRIDSSGLVLLGTTSTGYAGYGDALTIYKANHVGLTLRTATNKDAAIYFADSTSGNGRYAGSINYNHTNNYLSFAANENERLRIDSVGRHGINVTNTSDYYSAADDLIIREKDGGDTGITLRTGTANSGLICFADGASSSSDQYRRGQIRYHHNSDSMDFTTAGNDARLTILSDGKVGIGVTDPAGLLEIQGNVSSTTQFSGLDGLRIHNANGSAHNVTADMYFTAGTSSNNRGAAIGVQFTSAASGNDLYFATNPGNITSANTLHERLRITSTGDVCVNATARTNLAGTQYSKLLVDLSNNPDYVHFKKNLGQNQPILNITHNQDYMAAIRYANSGDAWASGVQSDGAYFFSHGMGATGGGGTEKLKIGSDGTLTATGTSDGVLQLDTSDSRGAFIRFGQGGSYHHMVGCGDGLVNGTDKEDLVLRSKDNLAFCTDAANERMRIKSNGLVGINDTNPSAYLDINQGGIDSDVPGINISMTGVGGGTAGDQYGLKITGGGYNSATHIYGIYVNKTQQLTQQSTAAYHRMAGVYSTLYGTQSVVECTDTGATGTVYGTYSSARGNSGSAKNKVGYGIWAESTGTNFQLANACYLNTVAGATLIYGIIYKHAGSERFRVDSVGGVWSATNGYTSDRDLKDNITTLSGTSLDKIKQLTPKTFTWKLDDRVTESNTLTGLIAQEVKPILPDIVSGTDGQKDMAINYNGLVAHLVNAVKELESRIAALESS